jgi:hypothetical protein
LKRHFQVSDGIPLHFACSLLAGIITHHSTESVFANADLGLISMTRNIGGLVQGEDAILDSILGGDLSLSDSDEDSDKEDCGRE